MNGEIIVEWVVSTSSKKNKLEKIFLSKKRTWRKSPKWNIYEENKEIKKKILKSKFNISEYQIRA